MSGFGTLQLVNAVGMTLHVNVETVEDAFAVMRRFGSQGWSSGEIPPGGILLPYAMADTFDWALIGAHEWTSPEQERGVFHRGQFYKRREYDAKTTGKKMPAAIKYSRGAKPTDPPHLKEGDDDGVQYVTLAVFKGPGKTISELTRGGRPAAERPKPARHAPEPGEQRPAAAPDTDDPLALLTEGQRGVIVKRAQQAGLDLTSKEGAVQLRGYVRAVMPDGADQLDAAHIPPLLAKLASRAA